MERQGFIHDMMDVKVLILYAMSFVTQPATEQEIYEMCYQDDRVSYFDVRTAIPEMAASGHLKEEEGLYLITELGQDTCELVKDSLAYPVALRVQYAAEQFNTDSKDAQSVNAELNLDDIDNPMASMRFFQEDKLKLELKIAVSSSDEGRAMIKAFRQHGEEFFETCKELLLADAELDCE